MPPKHRIPKLKSQTKYEEAHIYQLMRGHDFFGSAFGRHGDVDFIAMRMAWRELKDELLPAWIEKHPCTRPYAWWLFDAPGRRHRLNGPHPHDRPGREGPTELFFGKPAVWMPGDPQDAEFETEEDFLDRHGLLEFSEKEARYADCDAEGV